MDEYQYLHECGVDYVTVFQETYNPEKYETLHLMGHKRIWPYRFDSQERALMGGMRGAGFSALLGLDDFRKDALATALHVYYINRKYPHAELSLSCPRLRPIVNNDKINPRDVGDEQFEINDDRSFEKMYEDMEHGGLQPVLNDYIYV